MSCAVEGMLNSAQRKLNSAQRKACFNGIRLVDESELKRLDDGLSLYDLWRQSPDEFDFRVKKEAKPTPQQLADLLGYAARQNDVSLVEHLLADNDLHDLNVPTSKNHSPFLQALKARSLESMDVFLKHGVNVEAVDPETRTGYMELLASMPKSFKDKGFVSDILWRHAMAHRRDFRSEPIREFVEPFQAAPWKQEGLSREDAEILRAIHLRQQQETISGAFALVARERGESFSSRIH